MFVLQCCPWPEVSYVSNSPSPGFNTSHNSFPVAEGYGRLRFLKIVIIIIIIIKLYLALFIQDMQLKVLYKMTHHMLKTNKKFPSDYLLRIVCKIMVPL